MVGRLPGSAILVFFDVRSGSKVIVFVGFELQQFLRVAK